MYIKSDLMHPKHQKPNTGLMIPIAARLFIILNTAKAITISPALLKKTPAAELLCIASELKLTTAKTGKVPKANASIVSPPAKKLPVESV